MADITRENRVLALRSNRALARALDGCGLFAGGGVDGGNEKPFGAMDPITRADATESPRET